MNVFNVHSNKIPISGEIVDKFYYPGKFVNASLSKASLENEGATIHSRNDFFISFAESIKNDFNVELIYIEDNYKFEARRFPLIEISNFKSDSGVLGAAILALNFNLAVLPIPL